MGGIWVIRRNEGGLLILSHEGGARPTTQSAGS